MQEYDVTSLLQAGENTIAFTVSEGWYKGGLTWLKKRCFYGADTAVCAELIVDGKLVMLTDESFYARESHIRESGIYDGETADYKCLLQ